MDLSTGQWQKLAGDGRAAWARLADTLHLELDLAAVWRDNLGGDFDVTGRGAEYRGGWRSLRLRVLPDPLNSQHSAMTS